MTPKAMKACLVLAIGIVAGSAAAFVALGPPPGHGPRRDATFDGNLRCVDPAWTCRATVTYWWSLKENWQPISPDKFSVEIAPRAYVDLDFTWAWRGDACGVLHVSVQTPGDSQTRRWEGCSGDTVREGIELQP